MHPNTEPKFNHYLRSNLSRGQFTAILSNEHERILNLRRLPGFLSVEFTAIITGLNHVELGFIAQKGILRPLGYEFPRIKRLYCTSQVEAFLANCSACEAARRACVEAYDHKNKSRR